MKILYVIGNGFDLHHDINCSYSDFKEWLGEHDRSFLLKMDVIYGCCDGKWWCDFENNLGEIDVMEYAQRVAFENGVDLSSDHCDRMWSDAQIEVENEMGYLYSALQGYFEKWVTQLNAPNVQKRVYLEIQEASFLSFNYTQTLEDIYNVKPEQVLHIHGVAGNGERLIIGHRFSKKQLKDLYPTPYDLYKQGKIDEETVSSYDVHDEWAWDEAFSQVASMQKPVKQLIQDHQNFFGAIKGALKVCAYGLSFSEVDLPYLKEVIAMAPLAKWEISYYSENDEERVTAFAAANDLKNYKLVRLSSLKDPGQLSLDF